MNPLIDALIVAVLTQMSKRLPTLKGASVTKIRMFAGALSIISTVALAYSTGNLADASTASLVQDTLITYFGSVLAYHGLIK